MDTYENTVKAILEIRGRTDAPIRTFIVPQSEIDAAEAIIGTHFPDDLKEVWRDVGGGFFHGSLNGGERLDAISCLSGPLDVADVMQHKGWIGPKAIQFPFFNEDGEDFILLIQTENGYVIEHEHARGTSLAPNIKEFIRQLSADPAFWVASLPEP